MPRRVEITIEADRADTLLQDISKLDGLIGVQVQQGISRQPPGDVITLDITNRSVPALMRVLAAHSVGNSAAGSFSISEPTTVVSASSAAAIVHDPSDSTWEEMEVVIGKNSNMTPNALLVMSISGILATIGIATNALHIVIGAMLIAPGFQPIVRIALGIVGQSHAWRRGLADTLQAYLALAAGAAAAALFLQATGRSPLGEEPSYLPPSTLISYWTTLSAPSLLVTTVGGMAGAILIATNRAVLTAGVMVALALVPGAAILALAIVAGEVRTAASGGWRWLVEVGIVLLTSILVFLWRRHQVHRRAAML